MFLAERGETAGIDNPIRSPIGVFIGVYIAVPSESSSQSHRGLHRSPIEVFIAVPLESSPHSSDTAAVFALGKQNFVALAVEPNKVIQKAWKNRVQSESKKRKACSRSDEALVMSAPPATRNLLPCAVVI